MKEQVSRMWHGMGDDDGKTFSPQRPKQTEISIGAGNYLANFDEEKVAWHRWLACTVLATNGAAQVVHLAQVHKLDVIRAVVVLDLAACPVDCFHAEKLVFLNRRDRWDVCRLQRALECKGLCSLHRFAL